MWGENKKIKVILFRWETIFLTYFFKIENKLYIKFKNKKQIIYLFCLKMSPVLLILYKQKSNIKNYLEGNSDREINTFFLNVLLVFGIWSRFSGWLRDVLSVSDSSTKNVQKVSLLYLKTFCVFIFMTMFNFRNSLLCAVRFEEQIEQDGCWRRPSGCLLKSEQFTDLWNASKPAGLYKCCRNPDVINSCLR